MLIELYEEPHPVSSLFVKGSDKRLQLPAKDMIVLDTSVLFPTIFPLDEVDINQILAYRAKIHREFVQNPLTNRINKLKCERQLKVSKAIGEDIFQKIGYKPATTEVCCDELSALGKDVKGYHFYLWKRKVSDSMVEIRVDVKYFRQAYPRLSNLLKDNADFSVAIVAHLLGCDFASDDYSSFNAATNNVMKDIYFQRWGSQKRLNRHDSESLCILLSKIKPLYQQ